MIYDVNFLKAATEYLAPDKRKPNILSIIDSMLAPLQELHYSTMTIFRNDALRRARYKSQKIVMEEVLNNVFGITSGPRIYINNNNSKDGLYFYKQTEGLNKHYFSNARPVYFSNPTEYNPETDVTIFVPTSHAPLTRQIRLFAKKLLVVGVRYNLVVY